jgi:hypothetical protein
VYVRFEAPLGTTLFHITKEPLGLKDFLEVYDDAGDLFSRWGRSRTVAKWIGGFHLVDAAIGGISGTTGYVNAVPRHVQLTITYFQVRVVCYDA